MLNWHEYDHSEEDRQILGYIEDQLEKLKNQEETPKTTFGGILVYAPYGQKPDYDVER